MRNRLEQSCAGSRTSPLHWRHNGRDSVSNHQPHDCLHNRLIRHRSKKTSKLRVTGLCVGIHRGPMNSPHKGPVTRKMFPFDDVIMILIMQSHIKRCYSWWRVLSAHMRNRLEQCCPWQQGQSWRGLWSQWGEAWLESNHETINHLYIDHSRDVIHQVSRADPHVLTTPARWLTLYVEIC